MASNNKYYQKIKYICYECDKHYATLYFRLYNPLKNYRIFKKNKKRFHLGELQIEEYGRCKDCASKDKIKKDLERRICDEKDNREAIRNN